VRIGVSMLTTLRSRTTEVCSFTAATMSFAVTDPNKRPSAPAFAFTVMVCLASSAETANAESRSAASRKSRARRMEFACVTAPSVARIANPPGSRRLRACPDDTVTMSPRRPRPLTSLRSKTFMIYASSVVASSSARSSPSGASTAASMTSL
jgi:hypothetical protein